MTGTEICQTGMH